MDKQHYLLIIFFFIFFIFIINKYFYSNQYFSNENFANNNLEYKKIIDCGLHLNKKDCIGSYQCVWNEEPVENVKTPFCTGNILYLPSNSFNDY